MEKFQKYCLSVLLVIICSNISAQVSNGSTGSDNFRQLYEIYHQFLKSQGCEASQRFCTKEKEGIHFAIHHKQNAIDLIGKFFSKKQNYSHKNTGRTVFSEKEKHDQLLKNFEKNGEENFFAGILYFKSKVSKIRNKDYLDVIS